MTQAQSTPVEKKPLPKNEIGAEIRKLYLYYDSWTLKDVATQPNARAIDALLTSISDRASWHENIPQSIRNQYGDEAPRLFMIAVYDRLATLRTFDDQQTFNIRVFIKDKLGLTDKEADRLVLDRPITMIMATGETITATPAQAMSHQISRGAADPALADILTPPPVGQPYFGSLGGVIAIPNSVLDGIKKENPKFATRLETLRGKAVYVVDPQEVYMVGQTGQLRGADNVADWSKDWSSLIAGDPNFCLNVAAIERDLTNNKIRDVRVDEAQLAGAVRASDVCPVTLGAIAPTPVAANNNTQRLAYSFAAH